MTAWSAWSWGELAVDGCIAKAPGGGECAGPSPVDRRKLGMKRSVLVESYGISLGRVLAPANRHVVEEALLRPGAPLMYRELGRVGGHPLTHKRVLKADGSVDTLPLPPIALAAVRITRQFQADRRTAKWPKVCICGVRHQLLFTTNTGHPLEPRNVKRSFDARCRKAGVRQIKIHNTRRTCGSLLAALDVHPRVAMTILRHSRIGLTMDIYTQVPDKTTRDALKRLSDLFDLGRGDEPAAPADEPCGSESDEAE